MGASCFGLESDADGWVCSYERDDRRHDRPEIRHASVSLDLVCEVATGQVPGFAFSSLLWARIRKVEVDEVAYAMTGFPSLIFDGYPYVPGFAFASAGRIQDRFAPCMLEGGPE